MTKDRAGVDRWDYEGGASQVPTRSTGDLLPPDSPPRGDPTNPLFNPATSMRHAPEDAPPSQPNEMPEEPGGSRTGPDADADHPLGSHTQEQSR
jgi:hypothetical protein